MKLEDYEQYYIENSDHYLIPKEVFIELFNEMVNWRKESKKQKEVIDKVRNNLEKDISVIKNVKMSNKEIVCILKETNKMLNEVAQ